jgi:hypothetical protein
MVLDAEIREREREREREEARENVWRILTDQRVPGTKVEKSQYLPEGKTGRTHHCSHQKMK